MLLNKFKFSLFEDMNFKNERLLIIAPHADDEIGCSGLIDKVKKEGGKVYLQILAMGAFNKIGAKKIDKDNWKKEFLQVKKFLKIDDYDITFFDDETILRLDTIPLVDIVNILEQKSKISISKIRPTIVAIPTMFSYHQDHIATFKASITALRVRPQTKKNFVPNTILSYEAPEYSSWSPYSEVGIFSPNFYVQLNKENVNRKIKALNFYKAQLRKNHRDKNSILRLCSYRGSEIGAEYAEAFHIHRLYF